MDPLLSIFDQLDWHWNFGETASQGALLWPTQAYCGPNLHPHLGVVILAAPLSVSSPRDGVNHCEHFPGPPTQYTLTPDASPLSTPYPRSQPAPEPLNFLCRLLSADWRLLWSNRENEERAVWLLGGDLRYLCSLTRQNHRLRRHHPDGHTFWHGWALWWHQGIH